MSDSTGVKPRAPRLPIDQVRRFVLLGVLAALTYAVSATGQQFERSKECTAGFSAAFSAGFQHRHCDMVLRHTATGVTVRIPLDSFSGSN
jgi:hypothetical protein